MMYFESVTALFSDLSAQELSFWIEQRWVQPERESDRWVFHDIDVARVRLIHDLRRDFAASEETLPLVLSLIDQLYELRRGMSALRHALQDQPTDVQIGVIEALKAAGLGDSDQAD
jgi:chaperone modulatory protein CbpM